MPSKSWLLILSRAIACLSILTSMLTMPRKVLLSMGMRSMTLWNKLRVKSFANCLLWITVASNMIIVILPKNKWIQKTATKKEPKRVVDVWWCIDWPTSFIVTVYNVESYLPWSLILFQSQWTDNSNLAKNHSTRLLKNKLTMRVHTSHKNHIESWVRQCLFRFWMFLTRILIIGSTILSISLCSYWGEWQLLKFSTMPRDLECLRNTYTGRWRI